MLLDRAQRDTLVSRWDCSLIEEFKKAVGFSDILSNITTAEIVGVSLSPITFTILVVQSNCEYIRVAGS